MTDKVIHTVRDQDDRTEGTSVAPAPSPTGSQYSLRASLSQYAHPGTEIPLLASIQLTLSGGSIACILGVSGVGKTTLTRLLLGLAPRWHDGNTVQYLVGTDALAPVGARRRGLVGALTAGAPLTPWHRVGKGIDLLRRLNKRLPQPSKEQVGELLNRVGLHTDVLDLYPHELSFGMQHRVGIVALLAHVPSFLILDEFFTGLDSATAALVADVLHNYVATSRAVCLLTTHDVDNAIRIGDHRYHLSSDGHVTDVTSLEKSALLSRLADDVQSGHRPPTAAFAAE